MAPAFGLALGLAFGSGPLGAAAAPLPAPYFDDFAGSAGTITGRTVPVGSPTLTWTAVPGDSGNSNPLALSGTGQLVGEIGGSYPYAFVDLDPGVSAGKWYRAELTVNPTAAADFRGSAPTAGYFSINDTFKGAGSFATDRMMYFVDGDIIDFGYAPALDPRSGGSFPMLHTNTDSAGRGVYAHAGDVFDLRKKTVGGSVFIEPYYNGQRIGLDMDVTSVGVTINDKLGLRGDVLASKQLDAILVGDPAVHGMLSVYVPRVPQINADGSCTLNISGDYTGSAPGSLTWTLYDKATDTAVTGYVDVALASFATGAAATTSSSGSYTGKCAIAAGKVASTGAYIRVKRSGLAGGGSTMARSCVFTPGQVALMYGQSLTVKMWSENWGGLTFTAPANGWTVDGSLDNNGSSTLFPTTSINRKTRPVNGDLESPINTAYLAYQLNVAAGADKPLAMIRGGLGGTYYHERLPADPQATGIWAAALDGIRLAGNDMAYVFDCAGEYEAQGATGGSGYTMPTFTGTDQTALIADIQATYDALDALTGRSCKVIIRPVGAIFTAADVRTEAMRRLQWKLTQDFPSRYILGCYVMDQQHNTSTDQYHFATYQEQARRLAWAMAKSLGLTTFDRTGPKLFSVTAWSATSVTVRFDKNGASALEVVNTTGTLTDYRGGLTFATDSAFATQLAPTAVSVANVDATYADVTWTFAAASFPTKPYVRGPYGFNPFNRTNNTTINGAIQTGGSMVRGVFTGEDQNIPVQPYYSTAGDYIVGA